MQSLKCYDIIVIIIFYKGDKIEEKAYTDSAINANGMRASDAAFFESIYRLQTGLNNKTGMALGQNFQIFDEKVINNQFIFLKKMSRTDSSSFSFYKVAHLYFSLRLSAIIAINSEFVGLPLEF